jgi:flagellar assembly protein FliH
MSYRATRLAGPQSVEPFDWGGTRPSGATGSRRDGAGPQVDIAAIERDAFLKGYSQGEKAGSEAAAVRTERLAHKLSESLDELVSLRKETLRRSEQQTVQLALAISHRLIQREISVDRSLLVGMARAALDRLADYTSATIRLNPDDYAMVGASLSAGGPLSHVQVVADPSVAINGCVVQSDFGFMDVSPQAQLEELARAILDGSAQLPGSDSPGHGDAS